MHWRIKVIVGLTLLAGVGILSAAMSLKEAQQALTAKGYYHGTVDGLKGPKTRQAIMDFQKASGLPATGRLDDGTMTKLASDTAPASPAATVTKAPAQSTATSKSRTATSSSDGSVTGAVKEAGSSAKSETSTAVGEVKGLFGGDKKKKK